jgi:hypothetical protein
VSPVSDATSGKYWTLVDRSTDGYSRTYEHELPHGKLVRVENTGSSGVRAEAIAFVPAPVVSVGPYR